MLLARKVSGEEEVPAGVEGVITCDAPDLLAHISVRARNLKVRLSSLARTHALSVFFTLSLSLSLSLTHTHLETRPESLMATLKPRR